jgi:hypothetical protein
MEIMEIGVIEKVRFITLPIHGKWKQKGRGRRLPCAKLVHGRWRNWDNTEQSIQCKYCGNVRPKRKGSLPC